MARARAASRRAAMSGEHRNEINKKRREAYPRKRGQAFNKDKQCPNDHNIGKVNLSNHFRGTIY